MERDGCFVIKRRPSHYRALGHALCIAAYAVVLAIGPAVHGQTPPRDSHHGFVMGPTGPWELLVQKGMKKQPLSFPLQIEPDDRPQALARIIPILGSPISIELSQYIPDLTWETSVVSTQGAGAVATLGIEGPGLQHQAWLTTDDPERKAVSLSAAIGRVRLEKLHDSARFVENMKQLLDPHCVGLLSIRYGSTNTQDASSESAIHELSVAPNQRIALENSPYTVTILDYFPHYSRDNETKTDVNLSDQPANPAIKVKVEGGPETYEKWLWARFPYFGHGDHPGGPDPTGPLELFFTHTDAGDTTTHTIITVPQHDPVILTSRAGKVRSEKLALGKKYAFNEEYSVTVTDVLLSASVKENWKNNSETLRAPALVITVRGAQQPRDMVLELNKPQHFELNNEMIAIMFRPQGKYADEKR